MLQYFHLQGVENENIFVSWSKILGLSFKFSYRAFKFDQAAATVIGLLGATIVELTSRCRKLDRCSKTLSYDMQSVVMATSRSRLYIERATHQLCLFYSLQRLRASIRQPNVRLLYV